MSNDLGYKVIVAYDRAHFFEVCEVLGISPNSVKYVQLRGDNFENELLGYYAEDIYPHDYGRPPRPPRRVDKDAQS